MGAHSNYLTVESDFYTAILIVIIISIAFLTLLVINAIKENNYNQQELARYKKREADRKEAQCHTRCINEFFELRIEEDLEDITNDSKTSSKSKKLIKLYNAD